MLKQNLWKLILSVAIAGWAAWTLFPLKDRKFETYVQTEATKETEKAAAFRVLVDTAIKRHAEHQSPSFFSALRSVANEQKIDLSQYFPGIRLESSLVNIEKRNNILLDHLLKESKSKLQLGLDLKGGVAFTLEVDESALKQTAESERGSKLSKAIEILDTRINGLGVTEPIIRAVGDRRIEVQLAGVNTRDNPEVVDSVKKPALLEFRTVHPTLTPGPGVETPVGYEILPLEHDDRGKLQIEEVFVKQRPDMTGDGVSNAAAVIDEYGRFQIALNFNDAGSKRFAAVTREIAANGQRSGRLGRLAIVLDGKLYSAPTVKEEISGGRASISGSFTQRQAIELANVLNNPLDLPMQVKEQYEVGPSLAQDAIDSGVRASIIGVVLVAAFMITFYTIGGVVAIFSLAFNILIIFGTMASLGATLTLPGLAGIVLTIGMAVDANILIFERMREELKVGKTLASANRNGFYKALSTILDAHFVQLLICAIMIWLGTGPIKGFGVTLAIGVISTLISVLITAHFVMEVLVDGGIIKRLPMGRIIKDIHVDFVKYGKAAFIASWLVVLGGLAVIIYKGQNIYGIDFVGGDVISAKFTQKIDAKEIREVASQIGTGEVVPTYVAALGSGLETLKIETGEGKSDELFEALQKKYPQAGLEKIGTNHLGASIGAEIKKNALIAILASMAVTLLYIAFRFEFGFGIGAMFSSLHDILMTVGIFVLFGHHFSAPMVAAILAIAGYSINETVVVFDRIREELKLNPNGKLRDIVNDAISKVFARTIMTSTTTFLAALSLFLFGGGVLEDIAFTFLVGILTSTFSAIFISSQVFYWWHKGDRKNVEKHQDVRPTYEWEATSKASR
ncbi:protein translocase subunit SecDF [Opitutaceae bacterium TAV4]|nr:protein translocase subunit SecDF [Opitutaceae bacterium TAV4]RRK00206.1 protein translocase subunit SecDF [Opitutaceae bacterium TAV3]